MRRGIATRRQARLGRAVEPALRGREHRPRHPVPRVALARDGRRSPRARPPAASSGASSQPVERRGQLLAPRCGPSSKQSSGARRRGHGGGQRVSATSARPEWRGDDRQRAAGGGLGRDHPEGLRERARHDHRLGGREQVGELVVLEAPGQVDALGQPAAAAAVGARRRPGRRGTPPSSAARAPSSPRGRAGGVEIAARRARPRAARGPRGRRRSRPPEPRRAARARARAARPPAAARRPWRRSACRRRRRGGRAPGPARASAAAASAVSRAKEEPRRRRAGAARASSLARALEARARRRRLARREAARRRRRAGPSRVRAAAPGRPSPPTGSRRCGASRRGRRGRRPAPRGRTGRKRGCGLTVYSSALPWTLTA